MCELQDEGGVARAHEPVRARDRVEGVVGLHLPGVVDHEDGDAALVRYGLELPGVTVVGLVRVLLSAHVADLAERVDDHEPRLGLERHGRPDVGDEAPRHGPVERRCLGLVQVALVRDVRHLADAVLEAPVAVLQRVVDHAGATHLATPEVLA